jgi:Zn-finger nucleic acid-binding protein
MPIFQCPKCFGNMVTEFRKRMSVLRCTDCEGVWIDPAIFSRYLRTSSFRDFLMTLDTILPDLYPISSSSCPGCKTKMLQIQDSDGSEFEWCPHCRGIFFEKHELVYFISKNKKFRIPNLSIGEKWSFSPDSPEIAIRFVIKLVLYSFQSGEK